MKRVWLGAMSLAALTAFAADHAQTAPDVPLKGLGEFRLTIGVDDDAAACGVAREQIEAAVLSVLKTSTLKLNSGARSQLGARASTSRVAERVCAFAFALEVVPLVTIADTGVSVFAPVWSRQAVACGPTSGAGRLVAEVFRHASRELVADWTRANE